MRDGRAILVSSKTRGFVGPWKAALCDTLEHLCGTRIVTVEEFGVVCDQLREEVGRVGPASSEELEHDAQQ